jgi:hypothetical protein
MGYYNKAHLSHRLRLRVRTAHMAEACLPTLAHHWVIETPEPSIRGSYPLGRCRSCGEVARFSNRLMPVERE